MKPRYWMAAIMLGVAFAAGWTYLQRRDDDALAQVVRPSAPPVGVPPAAASIEVPAGPAPATQVAAITDESVARWTVDVDSTDAAKRSAAIMALAQSPRAQALPVLRRVALNGEPTVDRPLALKALRDLALAQGDTDNGVRQIMREVIYHGDDEPLAASAHEALDTVEQSEQKLTQR